MWGSHHLFPVKHGDLGEGNWGRGTTGNEWFMATFQGKGVIVCVITQGITLDTVRPLGVCVCVGRETSQARRHYGENAVSHKSAATHEHSRH